VGSSPSGTGSFIVMEYLKLSGSCSQAQLGKALALMHLAEPSVSYGLGFRGRPMDGCQFLVQPPPPPHLLSIAFAVLSRPGFTRCWCTAGCVPITGWSLLCLSPPSILGLLPFRRPELGVYCVVCIV
jgi:hypothetical protein